MIYQGCVVACLVVKASQSTSAPMAVLFGIATRWAAFSGQCERERQCSLAADKPKDEARLVDELLQLPVRADLETIPRHKPAGAQVTKLANYRRSRLTCVSDG